MDYKILSRINQKELDNLETIFNSVEKTDFPIRMGMNFPDIVSYYLVSRWYEWDNTTRSTFLTSFPKQIADESIVGWVINFPANKGFLDTQDYWVGSRMAGYITAYALTDNEVTINNVPIQVKRGQGIHFGLKEYHSIKKSSKNQKWACLMTLKNWL